MSKLPRGRGELHCRNCRRARANLKRKGRQEQFRWEECLCKGSTRDRNSIGQPWMMKSRPKGEHGQSPDGRDKPPKSHIVLPETGHRHIAVVGCPCNPWPAIGPRPRGELLRAQLNPTKRKKQQRVAERSFDANIRQQRPTSLTPTTPTSAPDQLTLNRQLLPGEHRRQAN